MHDTSLQMTSTIPEQAFIELQEVYARLSSELEPLRRKCEMRGICCDFAQVGHMLYVTELEAAEMARSGTHPDHAQSLTGKCPFMRGTQCGARDSRALGCRLYYCDKTYEENRNALYERYLQQVRQIETRFGIAHSYQSVTQIKFQDA